MRHPIESSDMYGDCINAFFVNHMLIPQNARCLRLVPLGAGGAEHICPASLAHRASHLSHVTSRPCHNVIKNDSALPLVNREMNRDALEDRADIHMYGLRRAIHQSLTDHSLAVQRSTVEVIYSDFREAWLSCPYDAITVSLNIGNEMDDRYNFWDLFNCSYLKPQNEPDHLRRFTLSHDPRSMVDRDHSWLNLYEM